MYSHPIMLITHLVLHLVLPVCLCTPVIDSDRQSRNLPQSWHISHSQTHSTISGSRAPSPEESLISPESIKSSRWTNKGVDKSATYKKGSSPCIHQHHILIFIPIGRKTLVSRHNTSSEVVAISAKNLSRVMSVLVRTIL